ncbi:MAG: CHAT domain-containing protein [Bacteroidota bacterium]
MQSALFAKYIRHLVGRGQTRQALDALEVFLAGHDQDLENLVLLRKASLNRLNKQVQQGVITDANAQLERNRTNMAIMSILPDLPAQGNAVPEAQGQGRGATPGPPPTVPTSQRTILFLSASPEDHARLQVDRELGIVKDVFRSMTLRDNFSLESDGAVTIDTITTAMQRHHPEVVHFSGHGMGKNGIIVQRDHGGSTLFPTAGLDRLFRRFGDSVKCLVLNACFSAAQAEVISKHGIYVIGMNREIGDKAAIPFSRGFYRSLGEGKDFEFAFDMALVSISDHLDEVNTPEIWLDGKRLVF